MLSDKLKEYNIILASNSPRRKFLLSQIGINFTIPDMTGIDEHYPEGLDKFGIPVYLAEFKSKSYAKDLGEKDILLTADTIVWLENSVINKPENTEDAIDILNKLSGKTHEVISGVCLRSKEKMNSFWSHTEVSFAPLEKEEIMFYIDNFRPFDKAGAYGIQEWIGYIGIQSIKGSYFNVMGLPVQKLYEELKDFIK